MKRLLILTILLFSADIAAAQTTITGTVRDAKSRQPSAGVNVMLQNTERRAMYGYAITKDDGAYSLSFNGKDI